MDDDDPAPNAAPRNQTMKRNPPPPSWIQKLIATVQSECAPSAVAGLLVGLVTAYLVRRRQGRIGFKGTTTPQSNDATHSTAQGCFTYVCEEGCGP